MNTAGTVVYPITIYYDASCPLCTREISLLKKFDSDQKIQLVDCSPVDYAGENGFTREAMMKLIHAKDASGRWMIGAPVFAAAYGVTGFASVARLWGARPLQPLWRVVYPWIANNRTLLSKLGAVNAVTWLLHRLHARAARQAAANSKACADDQCELPPALQREKSDR
jgi:predicted DCC family thiol-disulfide oxidoreductase YuxK